MRKIDQRIVIRKRVGRWPCVSGVGAGCRVAGRKRVRHRGIADGARESAIPNHLQLAIPAGRRQPDLRFDVGLRTGLECHGNATKRSEFREWILASGRDTRSSAWRSEGTCRDRLRKRHGAVRDGERREALARRCGCRRCPRSQDSSEDCYKGASSPSHAAECSPVSGTLSVCLSQSLIFRSAFRVVER